MSDYIRKAVELADGWEWRADNEYVEGFDGIDGPEDRFAWFDHRPVPQFILDALAAQLVRQVDALDEYWVCVEDDRATIQCDGIFVDFQSKGPDRTMNTIKAIVDSGVLE